MPQKVRSLLDVRFIYKAFEYVYECIITSDDIGQEIESLKKAKAHYAKLKFEIYDDYTRTNITREQILRIEVWH